MNKKDSKILVGLLVLFVVAILSFLIYYMADSSNNKQLSTKINPKVESTDLVKEFGGVIEGDQVADLIICSEGDPNECNHYVNVGSINSDPEDRFIQAYVTEYNEQVPNRNYWVEATNDLILQNHATYLRYKSVDHGGDNFTGMVYRILVLDPAKLTR